MSKQGPPKKPNSYSLLLKGVKEIERTKQQKKPTPKKKAEASNDSDSSHKKSADNGTCSKQEKPVERKEEVVDDPDQPDKSYGDFYCKLCDSHMNAIDMWEAHITGKRHIKNVEKGDIESKYDDLPNVESPVMDEMKNVKVPVVGLSYIHEIRRKEPNIPPIYNCFLCHASIATIPLLIEHILSLKHRYNYVKENDPDEYNLISATNLKKGLIEPLVADVVAKHEEKFGRGIVKVKQEKAKKPVTTYSMKKTLNLIKNSEKRTFNMDDNKSYKNSRPDPNQSVWKSIYSEKRQERSRSREFEDSYRTRFRSRSPRNFHERERMYPDEGYSMARNRSFSERDSPPCQIVYEAHGSFSKKDVSSRYDDYNRDYLEPPRKNFPDEINYPTSRYHTRPQEPVRTSSRLQEPVRTSSRLQEPVRTSSRLQEPVRTSSRLQEPVRTSSRLQEPVPTSSSSDYLKSSSQLLLPDLPSSGSKMTLADVLKIFSIINMEDRYQILDAGADACTRNMQSLGDVVFMLQHIYNIKSKMMKNDFYDPLMKILSEAEGTNTDNKFNIPGLDETFASSAGISSKNSAEAKSFTMNTLKDPNYLHKSSLQTQQKPYFQSPSSSISSQPHSNQIPLGNFQSSSGHSYQTMMGNNLPMGPPFPQNPNIPHPHHLFSQSSSSAPRNYNNY